jgi:hypothetical protein
VVVSTLVDAGLPDRVRKKFKTPGGRAKEAVMAEKSIPSFEHLSAAADSLNKATDELKQVIDNLDVAIRRLNVGVSAWVEVEKWFDEDDPQSYEVEQVGYSKQGGTWRLTIRRLVGHEQDPGPDKVRDVWTFNNAPRTVRLRAVEKLPKVLETLTKQLNQQTAIVNKKLTEAKLFTIGLGLEVPKVPK